MPSERLYYADAYTTGFTARVVERLSVEGQPAVVLDRTYFYPTGGGQPHDAGTIAGVEVVGAQAREPDGAVLHLLAGEIAADEVTCQVDWPRRFDFMQQHTGQHILTRAFEQVAGAQTVSFHLSPESVTIDLDQASIPSETLAQVEDLANQVIVENRPVTVRLVDAAQAEGVRVRLTPDHLHTGGLRVVTVEDFDATACGGTHVARTGEIGLLKLLKLESYKGGSRVEFCCGGRALRDYRQKHAILGQLAADLTVGYWEVGDAVARLRDELQAAQRALKAAGRQLVAHEAGRLLAGAATRAGVRVVKAVLDGLYADQARELASRLAQEPATLVLLGAPGEKAQIVLARSPDLPPDLNPALQAALRALGGGRGGGRPEFCQGGGLPAGPDQVAAALDDAERAIFEPEG